MVDSRIQFKPSCEILPLVSGGYLVLGPDAVRLPKAGPRVGSALEHLAKGTDATELAGVLGSKEAADALLALFAKAGALRGTLRLPENETALSKQWLFFADHLEDPDEAQRRLSRSKVLVLGCGGTGALVAQGLAAAGVGTIVGIDDDVVNISNFNRQYPFALTDVGHPKVEALERHLAERWPATRFVGIRARIESAPDLRSLLDGDSWTLAVGCADTPAFVVQEALCDWAGSVDCAVLFGAVGIRDGHVGPLLRGQEQLEGHIRELRASSARFAACAPRPVAGSLGWTNAFISAALVGEAIRFLSGYETPVTSGAAVEFDFARFAAVRSVP